VGSPLNVAYLTTEDPLYLPAFFGRVLSVRTEGSFVFVVPPLYKNQSPRAAAWRYLRTYGVAATWGLVHRVARAKLRGHSIGRVCESYGVPCSSADDVNDPAFLERLRARDIDKIVSVSCPQIFKRPLIELAPLGCLNLHGAILPAYRGVMPSFWMLANDEKTAGVSIFFVNEDIDAGDLCGQRVFDIYPDETLDAFLRRSKTASADLLLEVLTAVESGTVARTPLDLSEGSYYSWPDREAVRQFESAGRRVW